MSLAQRFNSLMRPGRVYILPTRAVITLALVLFAMWYAAVSQNNQMAYLLLFFLASLAVLSMNYTHFNLVKLRLTPGRIEPVFAGSQAELPITLTNASRRARHSVEVAVDGQLGYFVPLVPAAGGSGSARLLVPAPRRGLHPVPRLVVRSIYPLGLFEGREYHRLTEAEMLVYPAAVGPHPLPTGDATSRQEQSARGEGGEDYAGTRPYRIGESQRHVDWRAVARGQPLLLKQFAGAGGERIWLDWDALPGLDGEARLSQLARWVLEAERGGFRYGLKLPGFTSRQHRGLDHQQALLRQLALFDLAPAAAASP